MTPDKARRLAAAVDTVIYAVVYYGDSDGPEGFRTKAIAELDKALQAAFPEPPRDIRTPERRAMMRRLTKR